MSNAVNSARIAKNTLYLYARMVVILAANFYAVRILLDVLGVEDYGLFNLIVGFVTLFTLLNGAMQSTVQRFLCFEMGKPDGGDTRSVFSLCLYLFMSLSAIIVVIGETVGLWFLKTRLSIPEGRFAVAQIVYQFSIATMIAKTMQIPFMSLILSYERMGVFAKISLLEGLLTLGAAVVLKWTRFNLLIAYAALYTAAVAACTAAYAAYCRLRFREVSLSRTFSVAQIKRISAFFSWNVFGAVANMLKQQGFNVLINVYFGVSLNATWAVANKVGMAVNQLVGNFQQAFCPQILKSYADADKEPYCRLLSAASKFSFFLLLVCVMPLFCFSDFFLGIWLKGELPPQLSLFMRLTLVFMLTEALAAPFWTGIQATGRIAVYQMSVSAIILSAFFASWILFRHGFPAWYVMVCNIVASLGCHLYRTLHVRCSCGFPLGKYVLKTMLPVSAVSASCVAIAHWSPIAACVACPFLVLAIGVDASERRFLVATIRERILRH